MRSWLAGDDIGPAPRGRSVVSCRFVPFLSARPAPTPTLTSKWSTGRLVAHDDDFGARVSEWSEARLRWLRRGIGAPILSARYRGWRVTRWLAEARRTLARGPLLIAVGAVLIAASAVAGNRSGLGINGWQVLGVWSLIAFVTLAWESRKRTVFQEITDSTAGKPDTVVPGLAALLTAEVLELAKLYRAVEEQRSFEATRGVEQPLQPTLELDDTATFIQSAVSADSKISLGPLQIPVGAILALVARLLRGPRVTGTLRKEGDRYVLLARYEGRPAYAWRAEGKPGSATLAPGTAPLLAPLASEVACRMFADLALAGTVRWQAANAFTRAMRAYLADSEDGQDGALRLREIEGALLEAVAIDSTFDLAWHNLGVIYARHPKVSAARSTFAQARNDNPTRWEETYALASLDGDRTGRLLLCEQILRLRPGPAAEAQTLNLRGQLLRLGRREKVDSLALDQEAVMLSADTHRLGAHMAGNAALAGGHRRTRRARARQAAVDAQAAAHAGNLDGQLNSLRRLGRLLALLGDTAGSAQAARVQGQVADLSRRRSDLAREHARRLRQSVASHRLAVRRAWKALRRAEWSASQFEPRTRTGAPARVQRARGLAATCLTHLAMADLRGVELHVLHRQRRARFRAEVLLRHASRLAPLDAEAQYRLGKVCMQLKDFRRSTKLFRRAISIDPRKAKYHAKLFESLQLCAGEEAALEHLEGFVAVAPLDSDGDKYRYRMAAALESLARPRTAEAARLREMGALRQRVAALEKAAKGRDRRAAVAAGWKLASLSLVYRARPEFCWERARCGLAMGRAWHELVPKEGRSQEMGRLIRQELQAAVDATVTTQPEVARAEGLRAQLARWLVANGDWTAGAQEAERATEIDPFSTFEWSVLGRAWLELQDYDRAENAYRQAKSWAHNPGQLARAVWAIAACLINEMNDQRDKVFRDNAFSAAIADLDNVLALLDADEMAERMKTHYWLGYLHRERGSFDRAIAHLRIASEWKPEGDRVEANSGRLTALLALAETLVANGFFDNAAEAYRRVEETVDEILVGGISPAKSIGDDFQRPRTLPEASIEALCGQVGCYARRMAHLESATVLLDQAQARLDQLRTLAEANRLGPTSTEIVHRSEARIEATSGLLAEVATDRSVLTVVGARREALPRLSRAVDLANDPRHYVDLSAALVELLRDGLKDPTRRQVATLVRVYLDHAKLIDLRGDLVASIEVLDAEHRRMAGGEPNASRDGVNAGAARPAPGT